MDDHDIASNDTVELSDDAVIGDEPLDLLSDEPEQYNDTDDEQEYMSAIMYPNGFDQYSM